MQKKIFMNLIGVQCIVAFLSEHNTRVLLHTITIVSSKWCEEERNAVHDSFETYLPGYSNLFTNKTKKIISFYKASCRKIISSLGISVFLCGFYTIR